MASLSIFASLCVLVSLGSQKKLSLLARSIGYLHFTQIIDEFSTLPNVFNSNSNACKAMGFFHYYSSLGNICVCTSLFVLLYSFTIYGLDNPLLENKFIWLELFVFFFPMITVLPFASNDYGSTSNSQNTDLCTLLGGHSGNEWSVGILYFWVWLMLIVQIGIFGAVLFGSWKRGDLDMCFRIFRTAGYYPIVCFVCWIPRTIQRVASLSNLTSLLPWLFNFPIYVCGIAYAAVYFYEYSSFLDFEARTMTLPGSATEAAFGTEAKLSFESDGDSKESNPSPMHVESQNSA